MIEENKLPLIKYIPEFLSPADAGESLKQLQSLLPWRQEKIFLFGKHVLQPRLICFVADSGIQYAYSNQALIVTPWNSALLDLKSKLEKLLSLEFNSVLCNLYRNGVDSMGWHSDDEKSLGNNPVIASVSLGATRTLRFKNRSDPANTYGIKLESGSLLVMLENCQSQWMHSLPKTTKCHDIRINLTFRKVKSI